MSSPDAGATPHRVRRLRATSHDWSLRLPLGSSVLSRSPSSRWTVATRTSIRSVYRLAVHPVFSWLPCHATRSEPSTGTRPDVAVDHTAILSDDAAPLSDEALHGQRLLALRMDAAAPGWSRSSEPASRSSTRAARSAESRFHASRNALPTEVCSRSGRWPTMFPYLWDLAALHHAARTEDVGNGPPQPLSAVDDEQQRPVRRQSARHQVAQQAGGDSSRLGDAFAQAQQVFPALCVDPQRDHHAVVPEDLTVDADHSQFQLAQRPAGKRLEASRRQRHEPPRHRATRCRPLRHVSRHRVQGARVPAHRHPGGDRGRGVFVHRIGGRRPLEAHQLDFAVGAPHTEPRQLHLPPAKRHPLVRTGARRRHPLHVSSTASGTFPRPHSDPVRRLTTTARRSKCCYDTWRRARQG